VELRAVWHRKLKRKTKLPRPSCKRAYRLKFGRRSSPPWEMTPPDY
jgi:hypothetical protein